MRRQESSVLPLQPRSLPSSTSLWPPVPSWAVATAEEEEEEEEEEESSSSSSSASQSRGGKEELSMEERLAIKKKAFAKEEKERKALEAKAKADARAPTKPKDSKLFQAAASSERRKSELRDKQATEHSFQPKLATSSSGRRESGGGGGQPQSRTDALYEQGKAKGHNRNSQYSPFAEVSNPSELTYAPKIKTKDDPKNGSGAQRINRLYEQGVEKEKKRLQKVEAEKEIQARASSKESYDARLGFDKRNTGLGEDLVTTGARTNALYQEAQMRQKKKEDAKRREHSTAGGATFQPKLVSSRQSSGYGRKEESVNPHERLYRGAANKERSLLKKKQDNASSGEHSFQPDISKSQAACESFSLPGARHEALFMQGEVQRAKREDMSEYLVDGKEIDDLTFTPAVNYKYNDELLGGDEQSFDERLYKANFRGSKAHEEEHEDDPDKWHPECTFEPERVAASMEDEDREQTGEARIEKLYKDSAAIQQRKEDENKRLEATEKSRTLKLAAGKKSSKLAEGNNGGSGGGKPVHERLFGSWGKSLEKKEQEAAKPVASSFAPKLFTSRKSRESASQRQVEDLYKHGVEKQAARANNNAADDHYYRSSEEEARESTFQPKIYTKKAPSRNSRDSRSSVESADGGNKYQVNEDDEQDLDYCDGEDEESVGMNPLSSRNGEVSTDSVSSIGSNRSTSSSSKARPKPRTSTGNRKMDTENAARAERTGALKTKAAELLAKRQAAKEAKAGSVGKTLLQDEFDVQDEGETF